VTDGRRPAGHDDVAALWEMLTDANASVFGVTDYGLEEGNEGSLVVYDSPDAFNALRTQAPRTLVLRNGAPVARTEPSVTADRIRSISIAEHSGPAHEQAGDSGRETRHRTFGSDGVWSCRDCQLHVRFKKRSSLLEK
jgi:hypothetical protein